ncbi:hypothetical protein CPL00146S_CDS0167 [Escherichia phage SmurfNell]
MCFQKMSPRNNRPPYNRPVLNHLLLEFLGT